MGPRDCEPALLLEPTIPFKKALPFEQKNKGKAHFLKFPR